MLGYVYKVMQGLRMQGLRMQGLHINTYTQPTIPPVALMKGSFSKCYLRTLHGG